MKVVENDEMRVTARIDLVEENITFSLINTLTIFLFNAKCFTDIARRGAQALSSTSKSTKKLLGA